jgi:glutathione-specific gamma-glutamylcyclotransferase
LSTAKRKATKGRADSGAETPSNPLPETTAARRCGAEPVWIFAYGSLIWEPDFHYVEAEPALLRGYHRSCCLYSFDYRGTPAQPGLVLGLDAGGSCRGIAFRLAPEGIAASFERLWRREMTVPPVYVLRRLPIATRRGTLTAFAFTVRRDRSDYAGRLPLDAAARLIAQASGRRGTCRDYLDKTLAHLAAHGIVDAPLRRLAERVAALTAEGQVRGRTG